MMKQYLEVKSAHPDDVLFFRLGDFYEMFGEDAMDVSRLLNLTLTHRGDQPRCGIPYHAATAAPSPRERPAQWTLRASTPCFVRFVRAHPVGGSCHTWREAPAV